MKKEKSMNMAGRKCLAALLLIVATTAGAQEKELSTTIQSDFVNQYIWRGQDLGSTSVQPTLGIDYQGLSLTAWGSYGLTDANDAKEFDLTIGYQTGGFNIGVIDYWLSEGLDPKGRYFKYDAHGTNHTFEGNIGYDFGLASLQWYTNFAGNDGEDKDGERAYSSYIEAIVPFRLCGVEWNATAGVVPYATTFYETSGFSVTNLSLTATKEIKVTDTFSIPVFGQVAANPSSQKAYLVVGFTLQP